MASSSHIQQKTKSGLHPRNKHQLNYDFNKLISANSELKEFVFTNTFDTQTIDFTNAKAVKALNKALLAEYYSIKHWDIPQNYLCPPIPGRVDYLHYLADLLALSNANKIPTGKHIKVLDIGVGANCIYPLLGFKEYGWHFIGTDIDAHSIKVANTLVQANELTHAIELKHQKQTNSIFNGILNSNDLVDVTMCNPPFHSSAEEANFGSSKKWKNLGYKKTEKAVLNFGGQSNELWCKDGELGFITRTINESANYKNQCLWFTTLVSKSSHLKSIYYSLNKIGAISIKTVQMQQGNKTSRFVAWTFLNETKQLEWVLKRWNK